jgi:hypothetical protein
LISRVQNLMANEKNWVEHFGTGETKALMKMHRDVCEREIEYLDKQGYIVKTRTFPRELLNKYKLYAHLRKHDRVPRCKHAEKLLKKS